MPEWFASDNERWNWHEAQDIAWRGGLVLVLRDGAVWLVGEDGERPVCEQADPDRVWFETWRALKAGFPQHARLWVNGRPISNPGE